MKFYLQLKTAILVISSILPWPESTNSSSSSAGCSRDLSYLVRNFVFQKWTPIFEKYKVEIPLDCPLHPHRDVFDAFHRSKFHVTSHHWGCFQCGKSFFSEQYLDLHLLKKHQDQISLVEDSVCPADFCDLIRCEVLRYTDISRSRNVSHKGADNPKQRQEQVVTALARASRPQELNPLIRYSAPEDICTRDDQQCKKKGWLIISPSARRPPLMDQHRTNHTVVGCNEVNGTERRKDASVTSSSSEEEEEEEEEEELVVAMKHKQSVCHDGDFAGSRSKCARLIDACTEGIILRMTNQQFSHFRDELNRSVCWHLQCDRYWHEVWNSEANASTLFLLAVGFIVAGSASSYLIVCVLCREPSTYVDYCGGNVSQEADSQRLNGYQRKSQHYSYIANNADVCLEDGYRTMPPPHLIHQDFEENSLI